MAFSSIFGKSSKPLRQTQEEKRQEENNVSQESHILIYSWTRHVIDIQVICDVTNPLCYVMKKKFDRAMVELEREKSTWMFHVTWEPLILGLVGEAAATGQELFQNPKTRCIIEEGEKEGIHFNFKYSSVRPRKEDTANTIKAFLLLQYTAMVDAGITKDGIIPGKKENEVAEVLMMNVFENWSSLEEKTLLDVAEKYGFQRENVRSFLCDISNIEKVKSRVLYWYNRSKCAGIHGPNRVPFYQINDCLVPPDFKLGFQLNDLEGYKTLIKDAVSKTTASYTGRLPRERCWVINSAAGDNP